MTIYLVSKTGGTMQCSGPSARKMADAALRAFPNFYREVNREEWAKAQRKAK